MCGRDSPRDVIGCDRRRMREDVNGRGVTLRHSRLTHRHTDGHPEVHTVSRTEAETRRDTETATVSHSVTQTHGVGSQCITHQLVSTSHLPRRRFAFFLSLIVFRSPGPATTPDTNSPTDRCREIRSLRAVFMSRIYAYFI